MKNVKVLIAASIAAAVLCAPALAADQARSYKAPMSLAYGSGPMTYGWDGFYAGGTIGYGWSTQKASIDTGFGSTIDTSSKATGIGGGGTLGYNWQNGRFVYGVETDANWASVKGAGSNDFTLFGFIPGNVTSNTSIDWYATVRGRLGYALGDRQQWLPYLTGGYAIGRVSASGSATVSGFQIGTFNTSQVKSGWVLGGGVEYQLPARNWSVKTEYLHVALGDISGTAQTIGGDVPVSGKASFDVVRVGLNYRF